MEFRTFFNEDEVLESAPANEEEMLRAEVEATEADVAATVAERDHADVMETARRVTEYQEDLNELETTLESYRVRGKLSQVNEYVGTNIARRLARYDAAFGYKGRPAPSVESYYSTYDRTTVVEAAMESVSDRIKDMWKKVISFFKGIFRSVANFLKKVSDGVKDYLKYSKMLKNKLESIRNGDSSDVFITDIVEMDEAKRKEFGKFFGEKNNDVYGTVSGLFSSNGLLLNEDSFTNSYKSLSSIVAGLSNIEKIIQSNEGKEAITLTQEGGEEKFKFSTAAALAKAFASTEYKSLNDTFKENSLKTESLTSSSEIESVFGSDLKTHPAQDKDKVAKMKGFQAIKVTGYYGLYDVAMAVVPQYASAIAGGFDENGNSEVYDKGSAIDKLYLKYTKAKESTYDGKGLNVMTVNQAIELLDRYQEFDKFITETVKRMNKADAEIQRHLTKMVNIISTDSTVFGVMNKVIQIIQHNSNTALSSQTLAISVARAYHSKTLKYIKAHIVSKDSVNNDKEEVKKEETVND